MANRKFDIIEKLKRDLQSTVMFFESISRDKLEVQVYEHGAAWNVKQVLAHLITIEYSMQKLFDNILQGRKPAPENFDLERYNRTQPRKMDYLSKKELIKDFKKIREKTIQMVMSMKEEDLNREGVHAYHGHGRLERFIRWAYQHTQHHITKIKEKLDSGF